MFHRLVKAFLFDLFLRVKTSAILYTLNRLIRDLYYPTCFLFKIMNSVLVARARGWGWGGGGWGGGSRFKYFLKLRWFDLFGFKWQRTESYSTNLRADVAFPKVLAGLFPY